MEFTQEVQKATDPIYQKISKVMPEIEWSVPVSYTHLTLPTIVDLYI